MTLWITDWLAGFIVRTEQNPDGSSEYRTEILQVLGETTDGQGQKQLDVDQVWEAETISRTSALLAHDAAKWRVLRCRFEPEAVNECCACGEWIDPLDQDAEHGHCGRCAGEAHALERAAS